MEPADEPIREIDMKKILVVLFVFIFVGTANSQTTHNLDEDQYFKELSSDQQKLVITGVETMKKKCDESGGESNLLKIAYMNKEPQSVLVKFMDKLIKMGQGPYFIKELRIFIFLACG